MMVVLSDTSLTNTAMLAPRRLDELTRAAHLARLEEDMIIWILAHLLFVVLRCNTRRSRHYTLIGEENGGSGEDQHQRTMNRA